MTHDVGLDFTAMDFETANSHRGSACSVGMVRVRDGAIVESSGTLMKPPGGLNYFDSMNTWLHGIDAAAVQGSPEWGDVIGETMRFAGDDVVVFHNAAFNLGVIRQACVADNISWPRMRFFCTLAAARRTFRLPSYRLAFVAEACGFPHVQQYNPREDAAAAARVAITLAQQREIDSIEELALALTVRLGRMDAGSYTPSVQQRLNHGLVAPDTNPDADPANPLFGRVIVFTGALQTMTRQLAWEEVGRAGGRPEPGVTKRTNILVVGDINPAVLAPGAAITGKAAKAFELQRRGQEIEVMTEDDFLRSL